MADTIESAIYSLGADSSGYVKSMADATAADKDKIDSAEKVSVSEEKVTAALRASQHGLDNRIARLDPAVKAEQDYSKALEYHANLVQQGIGSQAQQAQYLQLVTEKYQGAISGTTAYGRALEGIQGQIVALSAGLGPIGVALSAFGPWGLAAAAGIGLITEAFGHMSEAAKKAGEQAIQLQSFATITGLSVEQIHGLDAAAAEMGVQSEGVSRVLVRFTESLAQARQGTGALYTDILKINPALAAQLNQSKDTASALNAVAEAYKNAASKANELTLATAVGGGPRGAVAASALLSGVGASGGVDQLALQKQGALTTEYTKQLAALRAENEHLAKSNEDLATSMYAIPIEQTKQKWLEFQASALKGGQSPFMKMFVDGEMAAAGMSVQMDEAAKAVAAQGKAAEQAAHSTNDHAHALDNAASSAKETISATQQQINALQTEANAVKLRVSSYGDAVSMDERRIAKLAELKAALLSNVGAEKAQADYDRAVAISDPYTNRLNSLKDLLAVAQAVTGVEKQNAQEVANYNQLRLQGYSVEQASLLAEQQKAVAIAQVNSAAQAQLLTLQDQYNIVNARTASERQAAQEAATYNQLVRNNVDAQLASAIAEQQKANATAQANASVRQQTQSLQDQIALRHAALDGEEASVQAAIAFRNAMQQGADATTAAALAAATLANNMDKAQISAEDMANKDPSGGGTYSGRSGAAGGGLPQVGSGTGMPLGTYNREVQAPAGAAPPPNQYGTYKYQVTDIFTPVLVAQGTAGHYVQTDYAKEARDVAAAQQAEAAKLQQQASDAQKAASEAQKAAAEKQAQAAADAKAAAEELVKFNDNAFRQTVARQIIGGSDPLSIEHDIMSGAESGGTPDSVFKAELDLERRGKVGPQQTINEIKQGIIGQGVLPTDLLDAIDSLTSAVNSNTGAVNQNTDTKCPGVSDLYFAGGGDASLKGLGYQAGSAGSGPDVLASLLPPGFNANPIMAPVKPFAEGGIATSPQFALFGEAGPEAFIPLRGGRVPVQMSGRNDKSAPDVNLAIHVASDVQADDFLKNKQQIIAQIVREIQSAIVHR